MANVLALAFPFFATIFAGIVCVRVNWLSKDSINTLNIYVFRFAMPAALFAQTSHTPGLSIHDLAFGVSYLIVAIACILVSYALARHLFKLAAPDAGAHAYAATLGNAVFLGLPIAQSIPGWIEPYVILMLMEGLFIIALGSVLLAAPDQDDAKERNRLGKLSEVFTRSLRNPLILAALSGFIFATLGGTLPGPIEDTFDLIGRTAGPTALVSLGLFLGSNTPNWRAFGNLPILHIVLMKMALLPLLTFLILSVSGLATPERMGAAMLFTLVPTGIGVYIQASQRGRYVPSVTTAIALTTLLSMVTISAVLYFWA